MRTRSYEQYCGLARAMELVGERWAMLVIRDLLPGPKRFTDLRRGLPRIPTNVLSARLKELEDSGIVQRRVLPRPSNAVVYELTDYGRELEPIVGALLMWGAKSLGELRPEHTASPSALPVGLRAAFRPEAANGLQARYELRLDEIVVHVQVDGPALEIGEGPLPDDPDLTIETDLTLAALLRGETSPAEALEAGTVRLTGDPELLDRFIELFPLPRAIA